MADSADDQAGDTDGAFFQATGRVAEGGEDKPRYRRYQYDLIAPHCGRSVLEVGAGLGEFAQQFTGRDRVVATDVDPGAVRVMNERFADRPELEARQLDLDGEIGIDEPVESVIAINVLEHFEDDVATLKALSGLVTPGGSIVLWVPAYMSLYGDFDRSVGHYRRYSPQMAREAVTNAGLKCEVSRPVNLLGGLAWWAAVRRGGTGSPNSKLVEIYDRFVVPMSRVLDKIPFPFGQSVLCVARVPR